MKTVQKPSSSTSNVYRREPEEHEAIRDIIRKVSKGSKIRKTIVKEEETSSIFALFDAQS